MVWWSAILFKGERKGVGMFVGSVAQAEMIERITGVGGGLLMLSNCTHVFTMGREGVLLEGL